MRHGEEMDILSVDNITYNYYDRIAALSDVSLSVGEGETLAIIGSNGCGKSTLLHIMNGLIYPSSGTVQFRGEPVSEKNLKEGRFLRFFRERVGYLFQDSDAQLFCPTVLDELLFGPVRVGVPEHEALKRTLEIMEMLQIDNLKDRPSHMLSGGEKKGWP